MKKNINRLMTFMLIIALMFSFLPTEVIKAQEATSGLKIVKLYTTALDQEYPLDFDTGGVTYGYKTGKVAVMDTYTRKLIKKTSFTEINQIKKIEHNVDAIVVKETNGKRLFGVINKNGNTLIPATKYTEIFFLTNGFRAVDAAKNNYFISRTGQVLCTYKNGEKVVEYGKCFAVINERSLDFKGMYDYDGNQVESIPESEKTASNQYYVIKNTLIKDMIDKAKDIISKEEIPVAYKEKYPDGEFRVVAEVTPVQNCYIIYVREDYMTNNNTQYVYSVVKDFLFDLKGNLIKDSDDIMTFADTKQYVASISDDKKVEIINTKLALPTAIKCTLTGDYEYLNFSIFGNYTVLSKCKSHDEGAKREPTPGIIFDMNGNIVKEFKDIYENYKNLIKVDGKYYNDKMEEISVDGELYSATNGYMIMKDAGSGKTQVTFTDFDLNKITSAVFDNSMVVSMNMVNEQLPLMADFDIMPNGAGVHLIGIHFSYNYAKHYFIDKNGKIVNSFNDSKDYHFYKVIAKGADNQIIVLKYQKAASVNLGKTVITSYKNTAPGEITLKWNTLKGITAYHVEVWSDDHCQYITKDAKTNSVVIPGLTKGMTYYVQIRAYVNRGNGWKVGIYSKRVGVKITK